jgi:outer membrane protein TolC
MGCFHATMAAGFLLWVIGDEPTTPAVEKQPVRSVFQTLTDQQLVQMVLRHPDVRTSQAAVDLAREQLKKARATVGEHLLSQRMEIEAINVALQPAFLEMDDARIALEEVEEFAKKGAAKESEVRKMKANFFQAKAEVAALEVKKANLEKQRQQRAQPSGDSGAAPSVDAVASEVDSHPDVRVAQAQYDLIRTQAVQTRARVGQQILKHLMDLERTRVLIDQYDAEIKPYREHFERVRKQYEAGMGFEIQLQSATADLFSAERRKLELEMQYQSLQDEDKLAAVIGEVLNTDAVSTKVYPIGDLSLVPEKVVELLKGSKPSVEADYFEPNRTIVITTDARTHDRIEIELDLLRRLMPAEKPNPDLGETKTP